MSGYTLTNMVGHIFTRMHRWKSPSRHRSKQMLGELRVLPNKPLVLAEQLFKQHEKVILEKVLNGELMVTCPDGTIITSTHLGELVYRSPDGKITGAQNMQPAHEEQVVEVDAVPLPEIEAAPPPPEPLPEPSEPPSTPARKEAQEEAKPEKKRRR